MKLRLFYAKKQERTRRNAVVTEYTLHGKNVVHMKTGNDELHFFYDAQNKPAVVVYNGTSYSYVKNLQGDIVAILDSNGIAVVQYKYDAWGRIISKMGLLASTLGTVQPFRYRGYVYDEETGLYYLRTRYYDPCQLRFVCADIIYSHNVFCYCRNKPTTYWDPSGMISDEVDSFATGNSAAYHPLPETLDIGQFLGDPASYGVIYQLVYSQRKMNYLDEEASEIMDFKLKLAQFPHDLFNSMIDSAVEGALGLLGKPPEFIADAWDAYGKISTGMDVWNYSVTNWAPSAEYYTTVALYKCEERNNYILYTITTSSVDSVFCSEGIRGVYPETIDWERELSLGVITTGP